MTSLLLGLIAALAWGIHDVCVRFVSQSSGILTSFLWVLGFGLLLVTPLSLGPGRAGFADGNMTLAILSGLLYAGGGIALYTAFSIGPVRLVAPVIGAFPILSIGWASLSGSPATALQWLLVGVIVAGVAFIAQSEADTPDQSRASPWPAILWSIAAACGFALTFAVGQTATAQGGELAALTPTRVSAFSAVLLIALVTGAPLRPPLRQMPILAVMGALDALALGCVIGAGQTDRPEFAAVAASTFGVITIILAALFLGERLRGGQWLAVAIVFAAIGYLAV